MELDQIRTHYRNIWGNEYTLLRMTQGPIIDHGDNFGVLEFAPRQNRQFWTYATIGMSLIETHPAMEIHIFSSTKDETIVELLTAISFYHFTSQNKLHLGDTVNFGRPWKNHSSCTYGFISLPYLDGPNLEKLTINGNNINFYWLIPITKNERDFKMKNGIDALEDLFETKGINYLNEYRNSLV